MLNIRKSPFTMPLQCPITLAELYRLRYGDRSGIRLPLTTISKNKFALSRITALALAILWAAGSSCCEKLVHAWLCFIPCIDLMR